MCWKVGEGKDEGIKKGNHREGNLDNGGIITRIVIGPMTFTEKVEIFW